jgi:starch phosphorylase
MLEKEIIPLFYDRGTDNLPRGWINKMKTSMIELAPIFNTNRMVQEYTEKCYVPAYNNYKKLYENDFEIAKNLATWKVNVLEYWHELEIIKVESDNLKDIAVSDDLHVNVWVKLGHLKPNDIIVQMYYGSIDQNGRIVNGNSKNMEVGGQSDGIYHYQGTINCSTSGLHGFTIRIIPYHKDLVNPYEIHLIYWQQ